MNKLFSLKIMFKSFPFEIMKPPGKRFEASGFLSFRGEALPGVLEEETHVSRSLPPTLHNASHPGSIRGKPTQEKKQLKNSLKLFKQLSVL